MKNGLLLSTLDHSLSATQISGSRKVVDPEAHRFSSPVFFALAIPCCIDFSICMPQISSSSPSSSTTHVLLLLVQRLLRPNSPPSLLTLVHLERTRRPLKVPQSLVAQDDGFLNDVVEKFNVVGDEDEGKGKGGKVAFQPNRCLEVLRSSLVAANRVG